MGVGCRRGRGSERRRRRRRHRRRRCGGVGRRTRRDLRRSARRSLRGRVGGRRCGRRRERRCRRGSRSRSGNRLHRRPYPGLDGRVDVRSGGRRLRGHCPGDGRLHGRVDVRRRCGRGRLRTGRGPEDRGAEEGEERKSSLRPGPTARRMASRRHDNAPRRRSCRSPIVIVVSSPRRNSKSRALLRPPGAPVVPGGYVLLRLRRVKPRSAEGSPRANPRAVYRFSAALGTNGAFSRRIYSTPWGSVARWPRTRCRATSWTGLCAGSGSV